jgi:tetratricopeptide (TPR) repeat protein
MKKLFYLLYLILIIFACVAQRPENNENKFLNDAVSEARAANKLLILEFWAPECGPCLRLKHDIFNNEKNTEFLNKNFILVQVSPSDSVYKPLWKRFHLEYQSSVIFMDKNGNEIDRTVSYDGNRDAYMNFLTEVSEGKNLYSVVFSTYSRDTLNVMSNYVLAKKYSFRYQNMDAIRHYNRVLALDPDNRQGLNPECRFRIAENEFITTGNTLKLTEYVRKNFNKQFVPKAYEYLINDFINKKDTVKCISLCEEAYNKYPGSYEILNKYAWAIYSFKLEKDYKKALSMARKSISINPDRAGTYSTEAWILFAMGDTENAIDVQKKAIAIYPNPSYLRDLETFQHGSQPD